MPFTVKQKEVDFIEAASNWELERIYIDLATAKGRGLTPVEKKILRGLLCGYSPAEIAEKVYKSSNSNAIRVYLSNGLYKYIEELLVRRTGNQQKVKTWSRVIHLLEEAGYKKNSLQQIENKSGQKPFLQVAPSGSTKNEDWGEAAELFAFYGRNEELATLEEWIVQDRCRLVALLGMGGVGKTALSIRTSKKIQHQFDYFIWRSLRHAPPVQETLESLLQFLPNNQEIDLPATEAGKISQLIDCLRTSRCLFVLDNTEAVLESDAQTEQNIDLQHYGNYSEGYEGYGELIKRVGETSHQSTLLLISREKPKELLALEGDTLPVRSLKLGGLQLAEAQEIFTAKGCFSGAEEEWQQLIDYYAGNPQILKIVATAIQDFFEGDISKFLQQGPIVFDDVCALLDQHFNRLSEMEKKVMYWLAINHGSVSLPDLRGDLLLSISPCELLEAIEFLGRRSLVEKNGANFVQKPMVAEYITKRLMKQIFH